MRSVNKVILIGRLGADPEVRHTANGDPVVNLSIATDTTWKDKTTGEQQKRTEWHQVVCYKHVANIARDYFKKGDPAYVEGKLTTNKWTDKNGIDRYRDQVVADVLNILNSKTAANDDTMHDDIPF